MNESHNNNNILNPFSIGLVNLNVKIMTISNSKYIMDVITKQFILQEPYQCFISLFTFGIKDTLEVPIDDVRPVNNVDNILDQCISIIVMEDGKNNNEKHNKRLEEFLITCKQKFKHVIVLNPQDGSLKFTCRPSLSTVLKGIEIKH